MEAKVKGSDLQTRGWDPNRLTTGQAEGVVEHDVRSSDLDALGWPPHELPGTAKENSIWHVVEKKLYHPKSPEGHRYRTLGGLKAVEAIAAFNMTTGESLREAGEDDGEVAQLEALLAADAWLVKHDEGNPAFPDWVRTYQGKAVGSKKKLTYRLPRAAAFRSRQPVEKPQEVEEVKEVKEDVVSASKLPTVDEVKEDVLSANKLSSELEEGNKDGVTANKLRSLVQRLEQIQQLIQTQKFQPGGSSRSASGGRSKERRRL